ncbi:MAG: PAS domain S-box protein [Proteobacteria bacterium]|nr:PAS domain S-box protein [Pseudomonadota bacterium]
MMKYFHDSLSFKVLRPVCIVIPIYLAIFGFFILVSDLTGTDMNQVQNLPILLNLILTGTTFLFVVIFFVFHLMIKRHIQNPIKKLIMMTEDIASGKVPSPLNIRQAGEIGLLAGMIDRMGRQITDKQGEMNQKEEGYQQLFELVPCMISVQNRDFKLIGYNQEFSDRFDPSIGDYCYSAYKGRTEKCLRCPVEKTFEDGLHHYSEETGINKDGTRTHWIVKTAPMKDEHGKVIGAMEMSLDITHKKHLEEQLLSSEKKYHAIFNNIPNPVFVLDEDTLEIIDCNESVELVYGFIKKDIVSMPFISLFNTDRREEYIPKIRNHAFIDRAQHITKKGTPIFVNIRISPSESSDDRKILLVTTSDITKSIESETQLIQTGKMATLGQMATGIAHELNQPLSVIKTASSYLKRKARKKEIIDDEILVTMAEEIDSHVDRASKIINHLRVFGRKTVFRPEEISVNEILVKSFEMFSQQLLLRGIDVIWDLDGSLPRVLGDPDRIEQVFINLLLNARDAIHEREMRDQENHISEPVLKTITIATSRETDRVAVRFFDTGTGISDSVKQKLFDPFFTTKQAGEGTGLGLSISYSIIKECGGEIMVENNLDGGATFIVRLPVSEEVLS